MARLGNHSSIYLHNKNISTLLNPICIPMELAEHDGVCVEWRDEYAEQLLKFCVPQYAKAIVELDDLSQSAGKVNRALNVVVNTVLDNKNLHVAKTRVGEVTDKQSTDCAILLDPFDEDDFKEHFESVDKDTLRHVLGLFKQSMSLEHPAQLERFKIPPAVPCVYENKAITVSLLHGDMTIGAPYADRFVDELKAYLDNVAEPHIDAMEKSRDSWSETLSLRDELLSVDPKAIDEYTLERLFWMISERVCIQ